MKILFLHGLEGSPTGTKATALRAAGHEVVAPPLPPDDFPASVRIAAAAAAEARPEVVVGSSRGGAVALAAAPAGVPLVLLAPAWRRFGVAPAAPPGTVVIHGAADDVVPPADSEGLVAASGLAAGSLVMVDDGHRLGGPAALAAIGAAVAAAGGRS